MDEIGVLHCTAWSSIATGFGRENAAAIDSPRAHSIAYLEG